MTVWAYIRVSGPSKRKEPYSIQDQEDEIGAYARENELLIEHFRRDRNVSGAVAFEDRVAGAHLLNLLKKGDILIATRFDRIFENGIDALETLTKLKKKDIKLHVIEFGGDLNTNGQLDMILSVLRATAHKRRGRITAEARDQREKLKEDGYYVGGKIPFGYYVDDDKKIKKHPAQQKAIRRMRQLRKSGMPYREIAETIEKEFQKDKISISYSSVRSIILESEKSNDS